MSQTGDRNGNVSSASFHPVAMVKGLSAATGALKKRKDSLHGGAQPSYTWRSQQQ